VVHWEERGDGDGAGRRPECRDTEALAIAGGLSHPSPPELAAVDAMR
jgi:hypothetical protein